MRILHLDSGRRMRGGQYQVQLLIEELQRRGHQNILLARGELRDRMGCGNLGWWRLLHEAYRADVIHAHDARTHSLAAFLPLRPPLVVSRRVAFAVRRGFASRAKYARAQHFLAISEFVRRQLEAADVPASTTSVVYDGIRLPAERPRMPTQRPWPPSPVRVITPASDDPLKCVALAEEAAKRASVGFVASRNLNEDLESTAAFVYLSESEGLGSAILLAAANGVPVIASDVGGIGEIIEHEESGLLVTNDVDVVGDTIERLLASPTLAERLARNAYRRTAERFSSAKMALDTEQVYRKLLAARKS